MEEMLTVKVHQWTFLYDTKSPDYRHQHMRTNTWEGAGKELKIKHQHMRTNAWEGTGKELKIKRKFYVSSCDVRIVCPRLKT
jgi:hypothetical protein